MPFLKWAGGKRWLTSEYGRVFPATFKNYYEPFLGGAAVYFFLDPPSAVLSDINSELVATYISIRDDWKSVFRFLKEHQRNHDQKYYYRVRDARLMSPHSRAARFLYLNRTCWNGLYRVNLRGQFNVPIGTKQAVILNTDDFEELSKKLRNVVLRACDFEGAIDSASEGDFIFADPPYTAKHNHNGFLKYNHRIFSWADQLRLRDALRRAHDRGCLFALTNAKHRSIADLYKGFPQKTLRRFSVISGEAHGRGRTEELLIRNYST